MYYVVDGFRSNPFEPIYEQQFYDVLDSDTLNLTKMLGEDILNLVSTNNDLFGNVEEIYDFTIDNTFQISHPLMELYRKSMSVDKYNYTIYYNGAKVCDYIPKFTYSDYANLEMKFIYKFGKYYGVAISVTKSYLAEVVMFFDKFELVGIASDKYMGRLEDKSFIISEEFSKYVAKIKFLNEDSTNLFNSLGFY